MITWSDHLTIGHLLPHVVSVLVLDVLRHVLQDQPIHVGAGAALRFGVLNQLGTKSFDPPKINWASPNELGHCLVVVEGQGAESEGLGGFYRDPGRMSTRGSPEGQIACPSRVGIHSQ